jgi:hypothetical protein
MVTFVATWKSDVKWQQQPIGTDFMLIRRSYVQANTTPNLFRHRNNELLLLIFRRAPWWFMATSSNHWSAWCVDNPRRGKFGHPFKHSEIETQTSTQLKLTTFLWQLWIPVVLILTTGAVYDTLIIGNWESLWQVTFRGLNMTTRDGIRNGIENRWKRGLSF